MSIIRFIVRIILWPIANPNWRANVKRRRVDLQLDFTADVPMSQEGFVDLGGGILEPLRLVEDGSLRVGDDYLHRNRTGMIFRERMKLARVKDLLVLMRQVRPDDQNQPVDRQDDPFRVNYVLTYNEGSWRQWRPVFVTFAQVINAELTSLRRRGHRLWSGTWGFLFKTVTILILIALGIGLYRQATDTGEPPEVDKPAQTQTESTLLEHGTP